MLFRKVCFVAPILMLVLAGPSHSKPDEVSEARKAIQAAYDKAAAATSKRDIKGRYASHNPNFVYKYGQTKEPLHMRIERDEVNFRNMKSVREKYLIKKFQLKGNVATVVCAIHMNVIFLDRDTNKPRPPDVIDATQQDTWVKGDKGWLLTLTKALK